MHFCRSAHSLVCTSRTLHLCTPQICPSAALKNRPRLAGAGRHRLFLPAPPPRRQVSGPPGSASRLLLAARTGRADADASTRMRPQEFLVAVIPCRAKVASERVRNPPPPDLFPSPPLSLFICHLSSFANTAFALAALLRMRVHAGFKVAICCSCRAGAARLPGRHCMILVLTQWT